MGPKFQKIWNYSYDRYIIVRDAMKKWLDKVLFCHVYSSPEILSLQGTLEFIKSSHCSISRFGDGEIKLISGKDLAFQPYSVELCDRLKEVLSSNLQGHLVCLPDIFKSLSLFTPSAADYWRGHLSKYRKIWSRSFDPSHGPYGNAFISRCFLMYEDKENSHECFSLFKTLWSGKDILLVEGKESRLGVGNDLFEGVSSIKRILAPNTNAFALYDQIFEKVKEFDPLSYLVLIALGPTATVLAYDLSKEGYLALDIGHLDIEYEWSFIGAKHQVPVPGKYVNEAGGAPKEQIVDNKYNREIVCRF